MGKIAIITGISGQDGSYLAELLIKKAIDPKNIATSFALWRQLE